MVVPVLERCQLDGRHSDFVAVFARVLAESLVGQARFAEALEPARLAVRAGNHEDWLEWCRGLDALGRCLLGLGRLEEARRAFREALGIHERCEFQLAHARLRETLEPLGIFEPAAAETNGHLPPGRQAPAAELLRVHLRDGREFVTCDRSLLEAIELAAATLLPALIEGETGTGKELVARLLHELGASRSGPFVVVDCSSLPAELADAELFGAARGAYTGAHRDRAGLVAEADGGTLMLDELPELTWPLQAKLLRTLQDGTYRRVGESIVRRARVRIVAATNCGVEDLIRSGRLKTDLFYRLNGHRIRLAPLRQRRDEIQPLAEQVLASCGLAGLTPSALRELQAYDWPGNVRELENTIERAVVLSPGPVITARAVSVLGAATQQATGLPSLKLRQNIEWVERETIRRALENAGGVKKDAAELMGISQRALSYYLAKYRLES
jgi:transcriptional regulator of acetoin/glycerol metabolism